MSDDARTSDLSPFDRVVCGVDGSDEGLEAAHQAARLARESLTLVAAVDPWQLLMSRSRAQPPAEPPQPEGADRLLAEAAAGLEAAAAAIDATCPVESKLVEARPAEALFREAERVGATLIAVGTHGRGRLAGIAFGSVATAVVHRAPCSVLVARGPRDGGPFPRAAVVGVDGSPESALAEAAACELAERLGTSVRLVVSDREADVDAARTTSAGELLVSSAAPVPALTSAAEDADLLVVGSRGLSGLGALGSVSERVVHSAPCSVLVVRPAAVPSPDGPAPASVGDVMSAPAVVARDDATLEDLARLMVEHGIGAVPVVSADGTLVGIVSESDFTGREVVFATSRYGYEIRLPKVLGELLLRDDRLEDVYEQARQLRASAVMSAPVHAASEDEPVQQALARMLHHAVDHMPVVRGGTPVGMLARHDLVRLALRTWEERGSP